MAPTIRTVDLVRSWLGQALRATGAAVVVPVAILVALSLTAIGGSGLGGLGALSQIVSGPGVPGSDVAVDDGDSEIGDAVTQLAASGPGGLAGAPGAVTPPGAVPGPGGGGDDAPSGSVPRRVATTAREEGATSTRPRPAVAEAVERRRHQSRPHPRRRASSRGLVRRSPTSRPEPRSGRRWRTPSTAWSRCAAGSAARSRLAASSRGCLPSRPRPRPPRPEAGSAARASKLARLPRWRHSGRSGGRRSPSRAPPAS